MKTLFIAVFMLTSSILACAQTRIAVKVGANLATIATSRPTSGEFLWGGAAGIGLLVPLEEAGRWEFAPDALYSMKGTRYVGKLNTYTERLHYADLFVPVRLRIDNFYLEAGPQVSVLLAASNDIKPGSNSTDTYNRFVVGLGGGLGYNFPSGPFAALRYVHDVTALQKGAREVGADTNVVFQLQVGYIFPVQAR